MTYFLYTLWIAAILGVLSELDNLITRPLLERSRVGAPEAHWLVVPFASAMVPGVGQFLNGQVIKAALCFFWPFLVMFGQPVPRPWQMLGIKTTYLLLPWYGLVVLDALLFSLIRLRTQRGEEAELAAAARNAERSHDMVRYLERRYKSSSDSQKE